MRVRGGTVRNEFGEEQLFKGGMNGSSQTEKTVATGERRRHPLA